MPTFGMPEPLRGNEDQGGKAMPLEDRSGDFREVLERIVEGYEDAIVHIAVRALMPVDKFVEAQAPASKIGENLHLGRED